MDIPYAVQTVLQSDSGVRAATRQSYTWPTGSSYGVFLLELDEAMDSVMPIECVVVRGAGGGTNYGGGTLELNDQRLGLFSYGATMHLAWNLDSAVYKVLKNLTPGVFRQTYLHWVKPVTRPMGLRDPDLQWPYVLSTWQALGSDLTIAA